jgi:hypothetical protein
LATTGPVLALEVHLSAAKACQVMELQLIHSLVVLVAEQCLVLVVLEWVAVEAEWEVD